MSFVPEEDVLGQSTINLAPMIDFLFLMLMFFACLAVTRITTRDTDIDLVELRPDTSASVVSGDNDTKIINISVTSEGSYKWVTEIRDHAMTSPEEIYEELAKQYERGVLPQDKQKTQVLMKIDREAQWDPILKAIFAIRHAGFEVRPVYEPEADAHAQKGVL